MHTMQKQKTEKIATIKIRKRQNLYCKILKQTTTANKRKKKEKIEHVP